MNWKNIWQHPKTSISGLLIGIVTVVGVLDQQGITLGHAGAGTVTALVGALAAALLGLLAQDPAKPAPLSVIKSTQKLGVLIFAMLLLPALAAAQTATIPPVPAANIANLYAAGVSYNGSANPQVAGTALYAHLLADTGTYAFTAVDALPESTKPFTVNTGIGVGIAQKVATIGKVPIYVPTAAGISFNGANTGWQWNLGALAAIKLKGDYYLMPTVRMVKSSVSNGSGYQPIIGLLFGWGK